MNYKYLNMSRFMLATTLLLVMVNSNAYGMYSLTSKAQSNEEETPLYLAVKQNNAKKVSALISDKVDLNKKSFEMGGYSPLMLAVRNDFIDCAKLLINAGADLEIANENGNTALKLAFMNTRTEIINLLVNGGANPNIIIEDEETPLYFAVKKNNANLVAALIRAKADLDKTVLDKAPLVLAFEKGYWDCAKFLIEGGANLNITIKQEETLLYFAVDKNNANIVSALISAKVDLNKKSLEIGFTPLMLAGRKNDLKFMKLLIDAGADLEALSTSGKTALLLATFNDQTDIAKMLINTGANPIVTDKDIKNAFSYAIEKQNHEIINTLINAKDNTWHANISDACRKSLLMIAMSSARKYPNMAFQIINPTQKPLDRKKIETFIAVYKKGSSCLSDLPKALLATIITYAYPEYAMDSKSIACLHPEVIVNSLPLNMLEMFIKNGVLKNKEKDILAAWQDKISSAQDVRLVTSSDKQRFYTDALKKVTSALKSKSY